MQVDQSRLPILSSQTSYPSLFLCVYVRRAFMRMKAVQNIPIVEYSKATQAYFPSTVAPLQDGICSPVFRFLPGSIMPHLSSHCCVGVLYCTFQGSSNASNLVNVLASILSVKNHCKPTKSTQSHCSMHRKPNYPSRCSSQRHRQHCQLVQWRKHRSHHHSLSHHHLAIQSQK
jgi:hypothetical protein